MSQSEGLSPIQPHESNKIEVPVEEPWEDILADDVKVFSEAMGASSSSSRGVVLRSDTAMTESAWELQMGNDGEKHWSLVTAKPKISMEALNYWQYSSSGVDASEGSLIREILQTVDKYPLLNADLEQIIFHLLESGGSVADLRKDERFFDLFPEDDRKKARLLLDDSETLRDVVYLSNMRLILHNTRRHRGALPFTDLLMAGTVGMLDAIDKFDHKLGNRFSTYATLRVAGEIIGAVRNENRTIRIPRSLLADIEMFREFVLGYNEEYREDPTMEEVERAMLQQGMSKVSIARVLSLVANDMHKSSVFDEASEKETPDVSEKGDVESIILRADLRDVVREEMSILLTNREAIVVAERMGMNDGVSKTLEQIGPLLGVTRERVRQIEAKALKKLAESPHLRSYMEKE